MKPSEMNPTELAWRLDELSYLLKNSGWHNEASLALEAAARLRNSIPMPKNIHVVVYDGVNLVIDGKYVCDLSDRYSRQADMRRDVEQRLRTALGINDTEDKN